MNVIRPIVNQLLNRGDSRSLRAKRNIALSFVFLGTRMAASFLAVPLTLHYLNPINYGIWLTINSLISWVILLDFGLSNGLRNKFAEAIAKNDNNLAGIYVSTTYAAITLILIVSYSIFIGVNHFVDWSNLINAPSETSQELRAVVFWIITFFFCKLIFQLIGILLIADQRPAINNALSAVSDFLVLLVAYILSRTLSPSLLKFSFWISLTSLIVPILASIYFFSNNYREFTPSFRKIRTSQLSELSNLGAQFLILNTAVIIIFSTDNLIISIALSPADVAPYNIAYKYFGIVSLLFGIILTPFWSAYTDAYQRGELNWIRKTTNILIGVWISLIALVIFMICVSQYAYHFWIGDSIKIPLTLSIFMGVFVLISTWNNIFTFFINGISKIRLQMYASIFAAVTNIPLSIFFAKALSLGSAGVILGTCFSLLLGAVLTPIQYNKILANKATGIWNK
ncbi:MAG: lipopolysaccharide biosynthesis protein [Leptolyngbya sp. BL-A-14]